jgi:lysophospholipase L1-like esterase
MPISEELENLLAEAMRGVAELRESEHGFSVHRLPLHTRLHHSHDPVTEKVADNPSGVSIKLVTEATRVELTYRAVRDKNLADGYLAGPSVVSLTYRDQTGTEQHLSIGHTNGDLRVWNGMVNTGITPGENSVAAFELPAVAEGYPREITLWLPHNCSVELVDLSANAPLFAAPPKANWIHYGSSISHAQEARTPGDVWPAQVARALDVDLYSLGLAGSANVELFAARTIAGAPADLVTLKIGINVVNGANMTMRTFVPAVHAFIDEVRAAHPEVPIVLISPFVMPEAENNPGPTVQGADGKFIARAWSDQEWIGELSLGRIRTALQRIVMQRTTAGEDGLTEGCVLPDAKLFYLDGTELFGMADIAYLDDGIHPNHDAQELIASRFLKALERLKLVAL